VAAIAAVAMCFVAACTSSSAGGPAATTGVLPATTSRATAAPTPGPTSTTTTTVAGSSTTSTSTSTTTTTTPPPPGEPARSLPPTSLPAPTGFARFEPGPELDGVAALTGRPAGPEVTARAALAVKIDNAPDGQPQWNLADADLVFEENVEGTTRFVAVYHTNVPDRIGPVRSARTSDLDILAGLNRPVLAWSGGNGVVTIKVRGAAEFGWLMNLSAQGGSCFWRSETRGSPHNLLLDPECAWASGTLAGPARPVFRHDDGPTPDGRREQRFTVEMDGNLGVMWEWDARTGRYLRSQRGAPQIDVDGDRVAAHNVVVLLIEYRASSADERSPEAVTVGFGAAVLHRDGVAIPATWERTDRFAPYVLRDLDGREIGLSEGTTFVELTRRPR
jgi:hypothetical protein